MNDEAVYGTEDDERGDVIVTAQPVKVNPAKSYTPDAEESPLSLLEELAEVSQLAIRKLVRLEVDPGIRPGGWILQFEAMIDAEDIKAYQRAATRNGKVKAENADNVKGNALPLIQKNIGIYKGSQLVVDADGDPVTLSSFTFLKMMGEKEGNPDAVRALKRFLGDAQIFTMGQALLKAAGYGDELVPEDPTEG